MKRLSILLSVLVLSLSPVSAERMLAPLWQPLSLLGTELEGEPLGPEEPMAAVIMARPYLYSSSIFEEAVGAIGAPHHVAGAHEFFPKESNLVVLLQAKVTGTFEGQDDRRIEVDLTQTTKALLEENDVTLDQFARLLMKCLEKNLTVGWVVPGTATITWKMPKDAGKLKLPREMKVGK